MDKANPRDFLRTRKAVLVHFNTVMSTRHEIGFPNDLIDAKSMVGPLSFSTIQAGDTGPLTSSANAPGSVGLVVDILESDSVVFVHPEDAGGAWLPDGTYGSLGAPPTPDTMALSIDSRTDANEWNVKNFRAVGIMVFEPIYVFIKRHGGDYPISLQDVLDAFPGDRIFRVTTDGFEEYSRSEGIWKTVTYNGIIPA